jgi:glycerol kinase
MLRILNIPRCVLPEIHSSSEIYGTFECMGATIPIAGIAGDQQAALFGQGCFTSGEAKNTYGTGCFLLTHTGSRAIESRFGLLTTIAATEAGRPIEYALEGSVFVGGAVIRWLRDEIKLIHESSDSEYFARKVPDANGVYLVPAFAGIGAPVWDMHARGTIVGLTAGTGKNHIIRAALESIAYQTEDVLAAMRSDISAIEENENHSIQRLKVDGGASANDLLMQMQSDFSNITVQRSANAEATAAGAAYLAGLAVGYWQSKDEVLKNWEISRLFEPEMGEQQRQRLLRGWHRAVDCARDWAREE